MLCVEAEMPHRVISRKVRTKRGGGEDVRFVGILGHFKSFGRFFPVPRMADWRKKNNSVGVSVSLVFFSNY
jgi:hypothetical protein